MQSTFENLVEFNLAESSVHPLTVRELAGGGADDLLDARLGYVQSNGTIELRRLISGLYPGSTIDNILVTTGGAEANYLAIWRLVEAGDEIVMMLPNYMQMWGIARGLGARVVPFHLEQSRKWAPNLQELHRAISPRTRLIAVCNPSNPTGAVLTAEAMREIVQAARRAGAWLLADEIYQGAERGGVTTPSFWGMYDKVLITNGLSKAYGLPGLRIGWMAGPADVIAGVWSYHDYTTICVSVMSDLLARLALQKRDWILERTRRILRANYPLLEKWIAANPGIFTYVPPAAGAITYLKYSLEINSTELVNRLREEKSVLVVPGDHFGMDRYLRVNFGPTPEYLEAGLARIGEVIRELQASPSPVAAV